MPLCAAKCGEREGGQTRQRVDGEALCLRAVTSGKASYLRNHRICHIIRRQTTQSVTPDGKRHVSESAIPLYGRTTPGALVSGVGSIRVRGCLKIVPILRCSLVWIKKLFSPSLRESYGTTICLSLLPPLHLRPHHLRGTVWRCVPRAVQSLFASDLVTGFRRNNCQAAAFAPETTCLGNTCSCVSILRCQSSDSLPFAIFPPLSHYPRLTDSLRSVLPTQNV